MKKLLILLLILPLLASCSKSGYEFEKYDYIDNKLIEGSWYWIQASDSTVITFKNNIATRETLDKYTKYSQGIRNWGEYKLTIDRIVYFSTSGASPYKLNKDTLFIDESPDDIYTKYIKVK